MVAKLYRSHACMLEWQGQISMLLGKLSTMVDHKTFLTIAYTMVKLLHQILLLLTVTMKLSPLTPPRHVPHNEWIFQRILPDPAKLKDWAEDLATLPHGNLELHYEKSIVGLRQYEGHSKDLPCEVDNTPTLHKWPQVHWRLQEETSPAVK